MAKRPSSTLAIQVATFLSTLGVFIVSFLVAVVFGLPCIADGYASNRNYCDETSGTSSWFIGFAPPALTLVAGAVSAKRRSWRPVVVVAITLVPVVILVHLIWTGQIS